MPGKKKKDDGSANVKTPEQFEKDLSKRLAETLAGRGPISDANNALSLLLGYVITRLGVPKEATGLDRRLKTTSIENHRKDFLEGRHELTGSNADAVRDFMRSILKEGKRSFDLDSHLLEPLLAAAGITFSPEIRDYRFADQQFMRALNINVDGRVASLEETHRNLFRRLGGVWIILRNNTHGTGHFNISILDIKPQVYFSCREQQNNRFVCSLGLHFSLRSREVLEGGVKSVMAFRGRVVPEGPSSVTLIGGRSSDGVSPVFMSLAWARLTDSDAAPLHITEVFGLTSTVNSEGDTVSAPVVGFHLPHAMYPGEDQFSKLTAIRALADSMFNDLPKLSGGQTDLPDVFGREAEQRDHVHKSVWYQRVLGCLESIVVEDAAETLPETIQNKLQEASVSGEVQQQVLTPDSVKLVVDGVCRQIANLRAIQIAEKDQGYFKARALLRQASKP